MIYLSRSRVRTFLLLCLSLPYIASACSVQSRSLEEEPASTAEATPEASAWRSLTVVVRGSRTQLSQNGHFTTVPTACYRRETGALDLELWIELVSLTNRILDQPWIEELECYDRPPGGPEVTQPVTLELSDKTTKELFRVTGGALCTRSVAVDTARDLFLALGKLAMRAYHEGCPPPA